MYYSFGLDNYIEVLPFYLLLTIILRIACDLDETAFAPVASFILFLFPIFNIVNTSFTLLVITSESPAIVTP